MHEYILRNWRMMKVATTKAQRKLFFNLRGMKKSHVGLTREQANEIAKTLKVKPEEVFEMEMRLSSQDIALDPQPNDEGESVSPLAYLTDADDEPSRILERAENERNKSAGLAKALATLDLRSRKIIEARWLNEGNESTLQTLANEYGVSAERIRQIEVKAMKTMRAQIGAL